MSRDASITRIAAPRPPRSRAVRLRVARGIWCARSARSTAHESQLAGQRSAESAHALRFAGDRHADRSVVRPGRGGMRELRSERGVVPSKRRCCVSERGRKHCARLPPLQHEQHLTVTELEAIARRSGAAFIAAMRALRPVSVDRRSSQAHCRSFGAVSVRYSLDAQPAQQALSARSRAARRLHQAETQRLQRPAQGADAQSDARPLSRIAARPRQVRSAVGCRDGPEGCDGSRGPSSRIAPTIVSAILSADPVAGSLESQQMGAGDCRARALRRARGKHRVCGAVDDEGGHRYR